MAKKYQIILQHNEEDCGAVCLASLAKYYGRIFTVNQVREAVGTNQQGTTLLGLKQGAELLGFNARVFKAAKESVNNTHLPAIIHWEGHWVILYAQKGNKYVIGEPGVGIVHLDRDTLFSLWKDGVIMLLEPDPVRFFALLDDQEKITGLTRLFKQVGFYRAIIVESLLLNFFLGLLSLASPFVLQILTDDVLVRGDQQLLRGVAIAVSVMYITTSLLQLAQSNLIAHFSQRLELGFVLQFARQILLLPLQYYETRRSGEVVSRLDDIQQINQLVSQVFVNLPSQLFIALVSLCFMTFYSWKLTGFALLIAFLMTLSTLVLLSQLQNKIRHLLILDADNQGFLVETFKSAITIKTTGSVGQLWEECKSRFALISNFSLKTLQIGIINNVFSGLVSNLGNMALIWIGSTLVIHQELTIGMLLAFYSMNNNFNNFITSLINFVDEFTRAQTAISRLNEVIDTEPEQKENHQKPIVKISSEADITCKDINFHYQGGVDLLQDFSLTIPGGKVTAIIGKSGCGKSTLVKLIAALYSTQSGNIRFGIYNQDDLSLDCLRQQIVLIPQETNFWSRSIIENFRLGFPEIPFEKIVSACQIAGADEFISQLPDKYQTVLGEFSVNLSGGQKQKLALARGIVNNPPILILDESTSALDPISENEVLNSILAQRKGKTTILISHRPKVIQRAEWIVMLQKGRLKQQGYLEDLRNQPGEHLDFFL